MKQIPKDELLYLAGFIDGDGCITAQLVRKEGYVNKFQIRLTVQLTQLTKRRHFLEDIQELIGAGTVRDVEGTNISHYVLTDTKQVHNLLKQIAPNLRIKKKQANLVIRIIEQLPTARQTKETFVELCKVADQVAMLNDSKNRTITAAVVAKELLGREI